MSLSLCFIIKFIYFPYIYTLQMERATFTAQSKISNDDASIAVKHMRNCRFHINPLYDARRIYHIPFSITKRMGLVTQFHCSGSFCTNN